MAEKRKRLLIEQGLRQTAFLNAVKLQSSNKFGSFGWPFFKSLKSSRIWKCFQSAMKVWIYIKSSSYLSYIHSNIIFQKTKKNFVLYIIKLVEATKLPTHGSRLTQKPFLPRDPLTEVNEIFIEPEIKHSILVGADLDPW